MAASKSKSAKTQSGKQTKRYAPADVKIPKKLGGGVLKELVEQEVASGKIIHYALAYINRLFMPAIEAESSATTTLTASRTNTILEAELPNRPWNGKSFVRNLKRNGEKSLRNLLVRERNEHSQKNQSDAR